MKDVPPALRVHPRVLDDIVAHARAEAPNECCGLLVGGPDRIDANVRARNAKPCPTAYLIEPEDHFAAIREARSSGAEVVGAYHSHPRSEPKPSATDLAEAHAGFLYMIVSLQDAERPAVGAFMLQGGNFVPVGFVPCPT